MDSGEVEVSNVSKLCTPSASNTAMVTGSLHCVTQVGILNVNLNMAKEMNNAVECLRITPQRPHVVIDESPKGNSFTFNNNQFPVPVVGTQKNRLCAYLELLQKLT